MSPRKYNQWSGNFPPGSPAEWIEDGHRTCNVMCHGCSRTVDVRLDSLPQDEPWARVGWSLVCTECGAAGSVHIVPVWRDRIARPLSN